MNVVDVGSVIVSKLNDLGVECTLQNVIDAPQVTRVEVTPTTSSIRMQDFTRLGRSNDLAFALGISNVTIHAPSSSGNVAIEFARKDRQNVALESLPEAKFPLLIPIGLGVDGRPALLPLQDCPHCLIAGQTGGGKSNLLHVIISQLLRSHSLEQLELALIDPKRVEMTRWEGVPHLAAPVADNVQTAIRHLHGTVLTIDRRYEILQSLGAQNIVEANSILAERGVARIRYGVIVIDELAELIMAARGEVESLLVRIAQKGRAAGVHLIVATQYPKSECVTGLLRVNLPTKISFAVPDQVASRLILGVNGAEKLLGKGDGLMSLTGLPAKRFQAAFATSGDIQQTIEKCRHDQ